MKWLLNIKVLIVFLLIGAELGAQVQVVENDWINYDQDYFKFPVYKDGLHRIGYQALLNAGVDVTAVNPRNIQIFGRGQEQYVYIQGEADGVFDPNDFIEFYAENNDGWYDYKLYGDSASQGNPDYSLITDTIYYYLTFNTSFNNKRLETVVDVDFQGLTPAPYCFEQVKINYYSSGYQAGQRTAFGWAAPEYSDGEGYGGGAAGLGGKLNVKFSTPNYYTGSVKLDYTIGTSTRSSNNHDVWLEVASQVVQSSTVFDYKKVTFTGQVDNSHLDDQTVLTVVNSSTSGNPSSQVGMMHASLRYPRTFNLGGKQLLKFDLPTNGAVDYLRITDFDNLNSSVWCYDLTGNKRILAQSSGGVHEFKVQDIGKERSCFVASEATISDVTDVSAVNGSSSKFTNYKELSAQLSGADYFIVTSPVLNDAAISYAAYRDQKGKKSMVLNVEELYDQYAYGIRKHPMAIRNVVIAAMSEWSNAPENLLLLGKSISARSTRSGSSFERNLVPTWGTLGADNAITSGIYGTSVLEPAIPTGRVAANTNEQVLAYLKKIQEYESAPANEWMKNVLHFGGGEDQGEQSTFKYYLKQYENTIESPSFGGKVHTFLKSSSDPLQVNVSDSVRNLINNGVTLMTFFGHAYANNFDQSIEEPSNYDNTGKYGFILANSCLIGNIHTSGTSSGSERFVLAQDRGTIGFLGSSSLGIPSYLHIYSNEFYKQLASKNYGKPLGVLVKETIKAIQDSSNLYNRDVSMHMTLHGDPALVLNSHRLPDYSLYGREGLSQAQVFFSPGVVTTDIDSMEVNVVVTNIGKAQNDSVIVNITRTFPNMEDTTYQVVLSNVYFKDTATVKMPLDFVRGAGMNTFSISIDPFNTISELDELNNVGSVQILVKSSEITPVYPYEFAIVPEQHTVLKASTGDPYAALTTYVFQIDTNDAFSSPSLYEEEISSAGGVVEWDPSSSMGLKAFYDVFPSATTLDEPQVFFWRVHPKSDQNNELWRSSSFQHVSGKRGWGQAHFHQYNKNGYEFLSHDYEGRKFDFLPQKKELKCTSHRSPYLPYRWDTKYAIDGAIVCQNSSAWADFFFVAVIDKLTLKPWHVKDPGFVGQANYYAKAIETWNQENFYFHSAAESGVQNMVDFFKTIPDSNYVLIYSFRNHRLPSWYNKDAGAGLELRNWMESYGADIDSMRNYTEPHYIFFTQIGDPSKTEETFSIGEELIELNGTMTNNWVYGTMTSTLVGPAKSWGSFHWEVDPGEAGNLLDSSRISLKGISSIGNDSVFIDTIIQQGDVLDLSFINASLYPNLELEVFLNDDSLRTPRMLNRWQVVYEELPELALNALRLQNFNLADTVDQGEAFVFEAAIENIGIHDLDSVQVMYYVQDDQLNIQALTYKTLAPLKTGEFLYDTVSIPSISLNSVNGLWYEVNPFDGPKAWQAEQYHFNNINLAQFFVQKDIINPILDVTFDGIHIMDGDIVSPTPNIVITLDDENQFLALNDPDLIQLYLAYPTSGEDSLVLLNQSEYTFTSGAMPKNQATIEFNGNFPQDGIYKLKIQSRDRSSNISGKGDGVFDYTISFEVINESSITQVLNWPNPFSTSTQFVFTLTGSEIPDQFSIQIMTITGKVVREVTKEEFGTINIGRNISNFKWDGRDQYGDLLANGVYLYRVRIGDDTTDFKERTVNISDESGVTNLKTKYFKKGFGKMYILR